MPKSKVGDYELRQEGDEQIMVINCLGCPHAASIEDDEQCMARTIDKLLEVRTVKRIILAEAYENEYGIDATRMLIEIANLIEDIVQSKLISYKTLGTGVCQKCYPERAHFIQQLLLDKIRRDPIAAYISLLKQIELEKVSSKKMATDKCRKCRDFYIKRVLLPIQKMMEKTEIIAKSRAFMKKLSPGDRSIYRELFVPIIRPNFTLTRYMATPPAGGEEVDSYALPDDSAVRIYRVPGKVEYVYHLMPPEFQLPQEKYNILGAARQFMAGHKPTAGGFSEKSREYFEKVGKDLINEIAEQWGVSLNKKDLAELSRILVRYTAGLGIMEVFLYDANMQDLYINAPIGEQPIRLLHAKWLECVTNIIPTREDASAMAARFRLESGRPLDQANPVLDTEATVPGGRARVCVVTNNLSPQGLSFTFRRHRSNPWTYPLFVDAGMMSPLSAGLLKFIIDHGRCVLFAGPRSSGKTSLLGATLVEIMRKYRIITVEDTLELPVQRLRSLDYNIVSMKVQSAITKLEAEMPADQGIRTALRMGDSCLIIGEVRSTEATALYEAMRVGALSNFVGGTIHGDSPYGVFDRVVHDLGVEPTSFKATDLIVMPRPIISPDGLSRYRRLTSITEVRKGWVGDPEKEGGFADLMLYDAQKDMIEPTDILLNGKSELLKNIASKVRGWRGDWDKVWGNIKLRAEIVKTLVDYKNQYNLPQLLEASFVVQANDMYHLSAKQVTDEFGELVSNEIYGRWSEWLKKTIRGASR